MRVIEHVRFSDLTRRFSLEGRVALVVGGSKGIGRAISETYADAGADIAVVGRTEAALQEAVEALRAYGGRVLGVRADVADAADRARIVPEVVEHFGQLDVLVNCAGAKPARGDLLERESELLSGLWNVNVLSYFELSLDAARLMKERGWGRIINVSSSTGMKARSGMGEYAITKAAELMMSRAFAVELGEAGITVNSLVPILTRTEFSKAQLDDASDVERTVAMQAIKRIAEPEDVCGAALLLASDAGAMMTGATLVVDGGASA